MTEFYYVSWRSQSGKILEVVTDEKKLANFVESFLLKGILVTIREFEKKS